MSILFAATYPEKVSSLILGSAFARWFPAPDYPCGDGARQVYASMQEIATHRWGQGATIDWYLPSRSSSLRRARAARPIRAHGDQSQRVPAHDPHDPGDRRPRRAARDPGAHSGDPAPRRPDQPPVLRTLPRLPHRRRPLLRATGRPRPALRSGTGTSTRCSPRSKSSSLPHHHHPHRARMLTTIVFAEAAHDTTAEGGRRPPAARPLTSARLPGSTCALTAAAFATAPKRASWRPSTHPDKQSAVRATIRDDAAALHIQLRAGIHTGEVDIVGDEINGISVHIADRITTLAQPGQILTSRTVKDLLTGSGIAFAKAGAYELAETGDRWPVYVVTGA